MIESDAPTLGWRANCGVTTGGPWIPAEKAHHINYLKLLAALLALKSFAARRCAVSILLHLDNITAIALVNRMGEPTLQFCCGDLVMVTGEKYNNTCGAPPRIR